MNGGGEPRRYISIWIVSTGLAPAIQFSKIPILPSNNLISLMLQPQFNSTLFIKLTIAFIFTTIAGTISHEFGHYIMAEWFGHDATLHYGSMSFDASHDPTRHEKLLIKLGGPLQTMLTGTIGLLAMSLVKPKFLRAVSLRGWQWAIILVTLFWLRQPFNLATAISQYLATGHAGRHGDEIGLALMLGLPSWSIHFITGLIGLFVFAIVLFKYIPTIQRFTFVCAAAAGCISGYVLWFDVIGQYILP